MATASIGDGKRTLSARGGVCHRRDTRLLSAMLEVAFGETHGFARRGLRASLREKNRISWIPGGKGKKGETNSNKYTLYLAVTPSRSDTHTLSEREGDPLRARGTPSQSESLKRIEKETTPNPTKELAGLLGESFVEAAKPRRPEEPSDAPEDCKRYSPLGPTSESATSDPGAC